MASAGDFHLICADGRFIAVPGGVFYHDGPMTDPIDPIALTGAFRASRASGATMVYIQERTRLKPGALERLRRALADLPAPIRDRLVLGTLPGESIDQANWRELAEVFGLAKHAPYQPGMERSARVVPLDESGLENPADPSAVRVLSRAQAAARETLHAALTGAPPSWDRLVALAGRASAIRDDLLVPSRLSGDEQDSPLSATYALAAGITLFGLPADIDGATLKRSVQPVSADEVLRAWGGSAIPTDPADIVATLLATPGSGALIRTDITGRGPVLGWLVSRPEGLAWINPALDGGAAIRLMPAQDAVSLLRTLPGTDLKSLLVGPDRPVDLARTNSFDSVTSTDSSDSMRSTGTDLTTPDDTRPSGTAPGRDARLGGLGLVTLALEYADIPFTAEPVARPNLTDADQRAAALDRVKRWTMGVEIPASVADPAVLPPEDCVERAWGAFVALHRRTGNVAADAELLETKSAEALAARLGGRLSLAWDPDGLEQLLLDRPGTMVLVRTPPRPGGMSHVFWLASTGSGGLIPLDSQRVRSSEQIDGRTPPAVLARYLAELRHVGTDVLLLDERGQTEALRGTPSSAAALVDAPVGRRSAGMAPGYAPPPPPPPLSLAQQARNLDASYAQYAAMPGYAQNPQALQNLYDTWYVPSNNAIKSNLLRRVAVSVQTPWGPAWVVARGLSGRTEDENLLRSRYYPQTNVNEDAGTDNCFYCSIAVEAHQSGEGGLRTLTHASAVQSRIGLEYRFRESFKRYRDMSGRPIAGSLGVIADVNAQGAGFRGLIAQYPTPSPDPEVVNVGHVFNVINDSGYVVFLDGQAEHFGQLADMLPNGNIAMTALLTTEPGVRAGITVGGRSAAEDAPYGEESAPAASHDRFVNVLSSIPLPGVVSSLPSSVGDVRAAVGAARSRWDEMYDRVVSAIDVLEQSPHISTARRASAAAVREVLDRLRSAIGDLAERVFGLPDDEARVQAGMLAERYELANQTLVPLLSDLPATALLAPVSEMVRDGRVLAPASEMFRAPGGALADGPVVALPADNDLTVLMQDRAGPPWAVSTASALPPYTVGVAPDGSYVVARAPAPGENKPYGFSGFEVFGPDGLPRGTIEASIDATEPGPTTDGFVATDFLVNLSDVADALDLTTFYATGVSAGEFFYSLRVGNEKVWDIRENEYRMEVLSGPNANPRDYRQERTVSHEKARERLVERGWTLPAEGFSGSQVLRPAWTSVDPGWAPVVVTADGIESLSVIMETLDGGSVRLVSGRYLDDGGFAVVNPDTGAVVGRLRSWAGEDRVPRWSGEALSPSAARWFGEEDLTADEFVRAVVLGGTRVRDDLAIPGFGLYRLEMDDAVFLVRAMVDADGGVVRARRPLALDEAMYGGLGADGSDPIAGLRGAGWTVSTGHRNRVDAHTRTLTIDPYSGFARDAVTTAQAHQARANDLQVFSMRGQDLDDWMSDASTIGPEPVAGGEESESSAFDQAEAAGDLLRSWDGAVLDRALAGLGEAIADPGVRQEDVTAARTALNAFRALLVRQSEGDLSFDTDQYSDPLQELVRTFYEAERLMSRAVRGAHALPTLEELHRRALDDSYPGHTVGAAPDGSTVVARAAARGVDEPHGFRGFDVLGPDGRFRGTIESAIEVTDDAITIRLEDVSQIPGAVELIIFYAAELMSDREFLDVVDVHDEEMRRFLRDELGMRGRHFLFDDISIYRLDRADAVDAMADRLLSSGWALPGGDFADRYELRPEWSDEAPDWAPALPGEQLAIVTETVAGGFSRRVSGRHTPDGVFEVVEPDAGVVVRRLHAWTAPGGGERWSAELLPAADRSHWERARDRAGLPDMTAEEFVRHVVTNGELLRLDRLLLGFRLYGMVLGDEFVLVRAMVDAEGRAVMAQPPLAFDRSQFPADLRDPAPANRRLADVYDAGWTVEADRTNGSNQYSRSVSLNPYTAAAWETLTEVHQRRHVPAPEPQQPLPMIVPGRMPTEDLLDALAESAEATRRAEAERTSSSAQALRDEIASMMPTTIDEVRAVVEAAGARLRELHTWADATERDDSENVPASAVVGIQGLRLAGRQLDDLASELSTMPLDEALDELSYVMRQYHAADVRLMDALHGATPLPAMGVMFRPGPAVLPPYTVGRAADGSYVVARAPGEGDAQPHGFFGFDVYGPDGRPRGVIDVEIDEDAESVVMNWLDNASAVPGALDLAVFYATAPGVSDRRHLDVVYVADEDERRLWTEAYRMADRPASVEGAREYRQERGTAHTTARKRLGELGWTLPDGDFAVPRTLRPAWTGTEPGWAPAVGDQPLDVIPETMGDGSTRPVSGRREGEDAFRVVDPATGDDRHLLRSSAGPDGGRRWTADPLSPDDLQHFARIARDGGRPGVDDPRAHVDRMIGEWIGLGVADTDVLGLIAAIVTEGSRLRDDLVLPGFGLYRSTVGTRTVMARAKVGPDGRIIEVHAPLALDEFMQTHDGHHLLTELRDAGWSIRVGHRNVVDEDSSVLVLDPFHAGGWEALVQAHRASRSAFRQALRLRQTVLLVREAVVSALAADPGEGEVAARLWHDAISGLRSLITRAENSGEIAEAQLTAELQNVRRLLDQAANRIVSLGGGAGSGTHMLLAPLLMTQPAPANPQIFRADVAYTDPPVLPRMPAARTAGDQVAELRRYVDAAEARVRAVLDRFPHSDAAEVARTALRELDRAENSTPSEADVQNIRFLLDQVAAGVIRLDPSARTVLRPLWSGREAPARPVPAARSLGSWADGDLVSLTAGLSRPVLSVNLFDGSPGVLADLELALRAHQRWGEVPIVITTLGTKATDEVFAELRERFRPIVVRQAVTADLIKVWRLIDQDGAVAGEASALTAKLLRAAVGLPAVPHGTALPPVLAGLLTAEDPAGYQRTHEQELSDPGVRDALDTAIANDPDGARLAAVGVALSLPPGPTERLVPAVHSVLAVEPPYTGGPVPASFAYDFAAQTGSRGERFPMDGLLFQLVVAGRIAPGQVLDLLRAAERTAVDRAVTHVFEAVLDVLALSERAAAADPHTDPALKAILDKVRSVSVTAREPGAPPPDCVDPIDRTAFVGRLDALRDMLRDSGQIARAAVIEAVNYTLANC
ncbi:hypothetical protein [Catenuloplanes indicus]|uniref:Uncharacterized protein n=1 Tax=Catenuloplanes indicus TaxID=137267 RepID=A0AAE4B3E4_9ACTN|nr:hypothetical protein [Catenuloplanes indicus]MDQ0370023.1 hypothetical protein [Catenuloplanes indicus]